MLKALAIALALSVAGCASFTAAGPSPEAQIERGAQTVTATTTLATVLLRDHKITVTSAKSYRSMLAAAGQSLHDANGELLQCRDETKSTAATSPDPCWLNIKDVVLIALDNIAGVKKALAAK